MPTTAGARNARVTFQRRAVTPDGFGNQAGDWQDLCGPYSVRLTPGVGREEVLAQRLAGVQPVTIMALKCSALAAVDDSCRAVNVRTGETYDIVDISNLDERAIELTFLCKKGTADG